ncbi:MAG TPA: hypothetical protein VGO93_23435, partial [Candidatus Xenobia bacterium]
FARTVYQTAYLKRHHPAAYMAAFMQHKPGFYPMNTVLEEAKHMGVRILPVDIWLSGVRYQLEQGAIRLPLTQVLGLSEAVAADIVLHRPFCPTLLSLRQHVHVPVDVWEALARAGAFDSEMPRRDALWQVGMPVTPDALGRRQLTLFPEALNPSLLPWLERLTEEFIIAWDMETTSMAPRQHPIGLHRPLLQNFGVVPIEQVKRMASDTRARVAGLVIVSQRPPTAKGMRFLVLEDETGRLSIAITPPVFERQPQTLRSDLLVLEGVIQEAGATYRSMLVERGWSVRELAGSREDLEAAVVARHRAPRLSRSNPLKTS